MASNRVVSQMQTSSLADQGTLGGPWKPTPSTCNHTSEVQGREMVKLGSGVCVFLCHQVHSLFIKQNLAGTFNEPSNVLRNERQALKKGEKKQKNKKNQGMVLVIVQLGSLQRKAVLKAVNTNPHMSQGHVLDSVAHRALAALVVFLE